MKRHFLSINILAVFLLLYSCARHNVRNHTSGTCIVQAGAINTYVFTGSLDYRYNPKPDSALALYIPIESLNNYLFFKEHYPDLTKNRPSLDSLISLFPNIEELIFNGPTNIKSRIENYGAEGFHQYSKQSTIFLLSNLYRFKKLKRLKLGFSDSIFAKSVYSVFEEFDVNFDSISELSIEGCFGERYGDRGFLFPPFIEKFKNLKKFCLNAPCLQKIDSLPNNLDSLEYVSLVVDSLTNVLDLLKQVKNFRDGYFVTSAAVIKNKRKLPFATTNFYVNHSVFYREKNGLKLSEFYISPYKIIIIR